MFIIIIIIIMADRADPVCIVAEIQSLQSQTSAFAWRPPNDNRKSALSFAAATGS